ncbi:hypothetical protein K502DRAFT_351342 [Neoconidiobolus thromboides FSU 785]|nr:hypothetical protein K502DRAFT_351342 [Neoconidiobolus thromboides FSU 785]
MSRILVKHDVITPTKEIDHYFSLPKASGNSTPSIKSTQECLALREVDCETFPPEKYNHNPLSEEELYVYKAEMESYLQQGNMNYYNNNIDQALQCYRQAVMLNNQVGKFLHKDREKFLKSCYRTPSNSHGLTLATKTHTPLFDRNYDAYPLKNHFEMLDRQNSIFWDCIAACYIIQNKFEDCIDACTTALDLTPGYSKVRLRRAQANISIVLQGEQNLNQYVNTPLHLDEAIEDLSYLMVHDVDYRSDLVRHEYIAAKEKLKSLLEKRNREDFTKKTEKSVPKLNLKLYIHQENNKQ